jgi:hypothetical protein
VAPASLQGPSWRHIGDSRQQHASAGQGMAKD